MLGLLKELARKRTGLQYLETILKYLVNAGIRSNMSYEDIKSAVEHALPETGGDIMPTIAETLIEQGMQKGMQQGMQQGILQNAREVVIDILEARFDVIPRSILIRVTELDDPSALKFLHKKAIKIGSLEEFSQVIKTMMD